MTEVVTGHIWNVTVYPPAAENNGTVRATVHLNFVLLFFEGNTTVKNVSGDTVIGKPLDCTVTRVWYRSEADKGEKKHLALLLQMVQIVFWRFPLTAEALMSTWEMVALRNSTVRKASIQYTDIYIIYNVYVYIIFTTLSLESWCLSLINPHSLSYVGVVSVRVPSSLRVGVELCGASVDISSEVVLHEVESNTTDGCTTLTGKSIYITS